MSDCLLVVSDSITKTFQAIQNNRARVHIVSIPRESGCTALVEFITESCDIYKVKDDGKRLKVVVTGVGANQWRDELNEEFGSMNLE